MRRHLGLLFIILICCILTFQVLADSGETTSEPVTTTESVTTIESSTTTAFASTAESHTTAESATTTVSATTTNTTSTAQPTATTKPTSADNPAPAADITAKCTLTSTADPKLLKNLTDGSIDTVWKSGNNSGLTIRCSQEIGSLYIKWDREPVTWTLTSEETAQSPIYKGGQNGFLHEFVALTTPAHSVTLNFGKNEGTIADIFIFGTGKVPDWIQQWQPMLEKADMLVLVAHSDDEFLWMGGTLPVYAGEYHKKIQVAYLIHHGAERNEYYRNHELLDSLWKADVTNYPMISDFEDYYSTDLNTEIKLLGEDAVLRYTVMLLRRFKPDIVITHDINGEYGHGAHKLCSYAIMKSIPMSGDPSVYPDIAEKYGVWDIKKCYLHLYSKNTITMNWNVPLAAFGGKTGMEMAKLCFLCDKSQQKQIYRVAEPNSKYDCRKFGLYYSMVGPDIDKNDFFENISNPQKTAPATTTHSLGQRTTSSVNIIQVVSKPAATAEPSTVQKSETTKVIPANVAPHGFHISNTVTVLLSCFYAAIVLGFGSLLVYSFIRRRYSHKRE